jgi:hypothetical protein
MMAMNLILSNKGLRHPAPLQKPVVGTPALQALDSNSSAGYPNWIWVSGFEYFRTYKYSTGTDLTDFVPPKWLVDGRDNPPAEISYKI